MDYEVKLTPEQVDYIIINELKDSLIAFTYDLENIEDAEGDYLGVFSNDRDEDIAEITRHVEALKLILRYYGGESTVF